MKGSRQLKVSGYALLVAQVLAGVLTLAAPGAQAQSQSQSSSAAPVVIAVSNSELNFVVPVDVGASSGPLQVKVKNNSTKASASLSISSSNTQFRISSSNCGESLRAGQSCTVSVVFSPRVDGPVYGTLSIGRGAPSVSLTGEGTGVAKLSVAQTSLSLRWSPPKRGSDTGSVTVSNVGSATLSGITASITGASSFTADDSQCRAGVNAGKFCRVMVTYQPTSKAAVSASLSITSANGGAGVNLSGSCPHFASP